MSWSECTLGDVCDAGGGEIRTGPFGSQLHESDYDDVGTPVVMPKDIVGARISEQSIARVGAEHVSRLAQHQLRFGDIVFGRRGDIGRQALVTSRESGWLCGTGCLRITLGRGPLDPRYLHYYLRDSSVVAGIAQKAIGATLPNLNTTILRETQIRFPPLTEQHRIASILSAYDDLIENNTRRIAILEEMARRIYEEWFVQFRFPGHEQVRIVESEFGQVPEGWAYEPVGSLLSHHIGGGWGKEEATPEYSVPAFVVRGTDIPDVRAGNLGRSPLRFHTASNFRTRKLKGQDVVFEVSGGSKDQPVGRAVLVPQALLDRAGAPVICASFCRLVRADQRKILPQILYLHFQRIYANREIMKYQTQSTGITNFKFTVFMEKEMMLRPAAAVQKKFAALIDPMTSLLENLGAANTNLRTTRDLLLPKLISGELDVSEMPEPEAVAA